jgi:hypothetical protein
VTTLQRLADRVRSTISFVLLLAVVAGIVAVRTAGSPSAAAGSDALRSAGADGLDAALGRGGTGIGFEVIQTSTLYAKTDGPPIELRSPDDAKTVTAIVDQYQVGTVLSRGGATADAFWMEVLIARDKPDFSSAELFARVLERDGKLWRDDGVGWYITDESPGVGMDPATAHALAGALRSLKQAGPLEAAAFDGRTLNGVRGVTTPDAYPGVIAADGAAFTDKSIAMDCWFDGQGRLVRLEARARNLNQEIYDLIVSTVVTISYGNEGGPPDPTPTMAPEILPTSEPEAAEVQP